MKDADMIERRALPEWERVLRSAARERDVCDNLDGTVTVTVECLERFAALIAEECAKVCDEEVRTPIGASSFRSCWMVRSASPEHAAAIRAAFTPANGV